MKSVCLTSIILVIFRWINKITYAVLPMSVLYYRLCPPTTVPELTQHHVFHPSEYVCHCEWMWTSSYFSLEHITQNYWCISSHNIQSAVFIVHLFLSALLSPNSADLFWVLLTVLRTSCSGDTYLCTTLLFSSRQKTFLQLFRSSTWACSSELAESLLYLDLGIFKVL